MGSLEKYPFSFLFKWFYHVWNTFVSVQYQYLMEELMNPEQIMYTDGWEFGIV